jgi:hypothetical protein
MTMSTDLLVTADQEQINGYHARKLMCKLRQVMSKDKRLGYLFYKEFPNK